MSQIFESEKVAITKLSFCVKCKHLDQNALEENKVKCKAYPNGIPEDIYKSLYKNIHLEVRDDQDNKIVFEEK